MKKMNEILKRCKSLSSKLGRSSSYSSLRTSKSTRSVVEEDFWGGRQQADQLVERETIYVGSSRRRYLIKAKLLDHPLVNALIERSSKQSKTAGGACISVKCEVVIFDHLLWMLENAEPDITTDSLEELAELYAY